MAEKVTFDGATKTITVNAGETQIDVGRDLYSAWKRWVYSGLGAQWDAAFRTFGGDITSYDASTDTTQYAPRYYFLVNDWQVVVDNGLVVNFESNLYTDATDGVIFIVTAPSSVRAKNNDLTILAAGSSQINEYGGWVYLDTSTTTTGSSYPAGTPSEPVNNLADAVSIASQYNIHQIEIRGIINVTQDLDDFYIKGGAGYALLIMNGHSNSQTEFSDMYIAGDLGPDSPARFEVVGFADGIANLDGVMDRCAFAGVVYPSDGCSLLALNPSTKREDGYHATFDFTNVTTGSFYLYGYNGSAAIRNLNAAAVYANFGFSSGDMEIYDTCVAGTIIVNGIASSSFENDTGGATVIANLLASQEALDLLQADLDHALEAIDYGDQVVIDTGPEGVPGTTYPIGTHGHPVNNIADAVTIAERVRVHKFHLHSGLYLSQDINSYIFEGITGKEIVILQNVNVDGCYFQNLYLAGVSSGGAFRGEQVAITNGFIGLNGAFRGCGVVGDFTVIGETPTVFTDCFALAYDKTVPRIIMGTVDDLTPYYVNFRGFYGQVIIENMSGPDQLLTMGYAGGKVTIADTCIDGNIQINGLTIESIVDNSAGTTVTIGNAPASSIEAQAILTIINQMTITDGEVLAKLSATSKQIVRDAMALATAETPALDSVDNIIDRIDDNTQE